MRIFVGVLCAGFAYFLGRSIAQTRTTINWRTGPYSWAFRVLLAGFAVTWRSGLDIVSICVFAISIVTAAFGFYKERQPKKPAEDLSKVIFPEE